MATGEESPHFQQEQQDHSGVPGLFDVLPDGSVMRSEFITPFVAASSQSFTRDVVIDAATGVAARIFLPACPSKCSKSALPLIVYFHGGGFCLCRAGTVFFHDHCVNLARQANALIVSVDYRLAPEHRLPAAYEDGARGLQWLARHSNRSSREAEEDNSLDSWILSLADFSQCFLMGEGSGANIIHHLMLSRREELPVNGLILVHPFFGGEERTPSETKFSKVDLVAPADMLDDFWKYALPLGADRDHYFSNPFCEEMMTRLKKTKFPRVLVVVGGRCSLQDRQVEYFNLLKRMGNDVLLLFLKNALHAFEFLEGQVDQADILLQFTVQFMAGKKCKACELLL